MLGGELRANVFRRSAGAFKEGEAISGGCFAEARLGVGCSERVEKFLVGGGDAIIEFVARGPESVYGTRVNISFSQHLIALLRTKSMPIYIKQGIIKYMDNVLSKAKFPSSMQLYEKNLCSSYPIIC